MTMNDADYIDTNDYTPECPECGEEMVKRKNRSTGDEFWGCPMYPQCDGTKRIDSKPAHPGYPDWARSTEWRRE